MNKSLKQRVIELEKRVAALEEKVQAQPSLKEIVSIIATEIKKSLESISL